MAKNNSDSFTYHDRTYTVKGFNCLVEMEMIDEKIEGSILYASVEHQAEKQRAYTIGYLRAVGADCWSDKSEPYAKVGDKVMFRRYAGDICNFNKQGLLPRDQAYLIVMKDEEILGTIS